MPKCHFYLSQLYYAYLLRICQVFFRKKNSLNNKNLRLNIKMKIKKKFRI